MPERYLNLSPVGSGAFGQVTIIVIVVKVLIIVTVVIIVIVVINMILMVRVIHDFCQVCSATDTERRSENGGDVRVAIKKIARPFQVNIINRKPMMCKT